MTYDELKTQSDQLVAALQDLLCVVAGVSADPAADLANARNAIAKATSNSDCDNHNAMP